MTIYFHTWQKPASASGLQGRVAGSLAAAVLCIGKSRMKRGVRVTRIPLLQHVLLKGLQIIWRSLLFSTLILVLIFSSSALGQGVMAAITAIIVFISGFGRMYVQVVKATVL